MFDALPIVACTRHTRTQVLDAVILTVSCANLCIHTPPDAFPMTWAPGLTQKLKSQYIVPLHSKDTSIASAYFLEPPESSWNVAGSWRFQNVQ